MATHTAKFRSNGRLGLLPILALLLFASTQGSAQDGQKGAPQEPSKGQPGPAPKSGGQSGGASTGVGVDVGEVIGLFRHHTKAHLEVTPQQVRAGDPVLFTTTVSPNAAGLSYEFHWTNDKNSPGERGNIPKASHIYPAPGQYKASVIVYSNGKKVATSNDVSIVVQQPSPVAQGQPSSGPAGSVIEWRVSLQPNQVKSATIVANNKCNQPQRWEVVSQQFPAFMRFTGDWSFDVNAHSKRDLPVQFDSSGLKEGEHAGTVIIRCLTCKANPDCNQDRDVVNVHVTVEPAIVASVSAGGASSSPTPQKPVPQTPGESSNPAPTPSPGKAIAASVRADGVPGTSTPQKPVAQTPGESNSSASTPAPGNQAPTTANSAQPQPQNPGVTTPPASAKATENAQSGKLPAAPQRNETLQTGNDNPSTLVSYRLTVRADAHPEAGKPVSFLAELTPEPPAEKNFKYCFTWGDGEPQICQDSPSAAHSYRAKGKYAAAVEAVTDQEKLAAIIPIQVEPDRLAWLYPLLLALFALVLAAAYGTHRARKVLKSAVSVKTDTGRHKISPVVVESGEGFHIRCVRPAAVSSQITFSSSDQVAPENKETAHV